MLPYILKKHFLHFLLFVPANLWLARPVLTVLSLADDDIRIPTKIVKEIILVYLFYYTTYSFSKKQLF